MSGSHFDDDLTRPLEGALEASTSEGPGSPAVGRDEWVARHGENRGRRGGWLGKIEDRLRTVPWWAWLTLIVAAFAALPVVYDSGYVRRVAFDTVVYMLLALGLNVVLGWGGLLDLGYVAFYGIGAYAYALLSSNQFDIHLPTLVSVPLIVAIGAVTGLLVGLPSRRLSGDYLAIVTLFFFQLFIVVTINGDHLFGRNVTGGINGIGGVAADVDPFNLFGRDLVVSTGGTFNVWYLYVALAFFAVVFVLLRFVNHSRIGRAWRSLREDPLAAEMMGMPVNWLKLLAFSFGAAVAALAGTLTAALQGGVFPGTFAFPLLIIIYTMVVLGGSGNQFGVVIGAILIWVVLEVLRDAGQSRYLFYLLLLIGLLAFFRASTRFAIVFVGTVVLGFVVRVVASSISDSALAGASNGGGWLPKVIDHWVITPSSLGAWGPISYVSLVSLVLLLTLLKGWTRIAVLIPTLYLAAFVWENVMLAKPEATRFIVLGAILVAVMVARPSGLLGEKRVEIV